MAPPGGLAASLAVPVPLPGTVGCLSRCPAERPSTLLCLQPLSRATQAPGAAAGGALGDAALPGSAPDRRTSRWAEPPAVRNARENVSRLRHAELAIRQPGWSNDQSWKGKSDLHLGPGPDVSRSRKQRSELAGDRWQGRGIFPRQRPRLPGWDRL